MTYRHLGFLVVFVYQSVVLCDQALAGNPLSTNSYTGDRDSKSIGNTELLFSESWRSEEQDTSRYKSAASANIVPDLPSDMVIQVGAFLRETNATALKLRLSDLINQKVVLIPANGFYKIRITGCQTYEEMGRLVEALRLIGIRDVWIFRNRPKEEAVVSDSLGVDSELKPLNDSVSFKRPEEQTASGVSIEFNLQVGVFHSKRKARRAERRIISKLHLPVKIVREWEYHIVFITGFSSREELYRYYPKLAALGYNESFMVEKPVVNQK